MLSHTSSRRSKRLNRQTGSALAGILILVVIVAGLIFVTTLPNVSKSDKNGNIVGTEQLMAHDIDGIPNEPLNGAVLGTSSSSEDTTMVTHVTVPKAVKGLYMSSWVAGTVGLRSKIVDTIVKTEANAVIIDIKDYTGMISFLPDSGKLVAMGCIENRIRDIKPFIKELHDKNIYVIGRVAVFQDPCAVKNMPEDAVKRKSDGQIWKDDNGISWMDAGSKRVWDYNIEIARTAHSMGFDEINFDYIRYPSDGNMKDIAFPATGTSSKSKTLGGFFQYIDKELRGGRATSNSDPIFDELVQAYELQISTSTAAQADASLDGVRLESSISKQVRPIISADLFGMVTNNTDDLGIGQVLELAAPYVDFIGPMVYPSHYPNNFIGYKNPAAYPYQIVRHAMSGGVAKLKVVGLNPLKLRPWLQDFNLGATYTADMVRKQIQATYDVGLTGLMLWDASNTYTVGGVLPLE